MSLTPHHHEKYHDYLERADLRKSDLSRRKFDSEIDRLYGQRSKEGSTATTSTLQHDEDQAMETESRARPQSTIQAASAPPPEEIELMAYGPAMPGARPKEQRGRTTTAKEPQRRDPATERMPAIGQDELESRKRPASAMEETVDPVRVSEAPIRFNNLSDARPLPTDNKSMPAIVQQRLLTKVEDSGIWSDTSFLPNRQKTFLRYLNVLSLFIKDSLVKTIETDNEDLEGEDYYEDLAKVRRDVTPDLDIYVALWHAINRVRQGRDVVDKTKEILYTIADESSIDRLQSSDDRNNRYKALRNPSNKMICFQMSYRKGNTTKYIPVCKYIDINNLAQELATTGMLYNWFGETGTDSKNVKMWMSARSKDLGLIGMNAVKLQAANFTGKRQNNNKPVSQAEKILVDRGVTKNSQTTRRQRAHYSNVFGVADGISLAITQGFELEKATNNVEYANDNQRKAKTSRFATASTAKTPEKRPGDAKELHDKLRQARANLTTTKERVARSFSTQEQKDVFEIIVEGEIWDSNAEKSDFIDLLRKSCLCGKFKPYLRSKVIVPLEVFRDYPELETDEEITREINAYHPTSMLWHEHRIFEYYFDVAFNNIGFIKHITGEPTWTVRSNKSAVKYNIFEALNVSADSPTMNRGYKLNVSIPTMKTLYKRITKTDGLEQGQEKEYVTQQTFKAYIVLNDQVRTLSYGTTTDRKAKFDILKDAVEEENKKMREGKVEMMKNSTYRVWDAELVSFGETEHVRDRPLVFTEIGNPMDL